MLHRLRWEKAAKECQVAVTSAVPAVVTSVADSMPVAEISEEATSAEAAETLAVMPAGATSVAEQKTSAVVLMPVVISAEEAEVPMTL